MDFRWRSPGRSSPGLFPSLAAPSQAFLGAFQWQRCWVPDSPLSFLLWLLAGGALDAGTCASMHCSSEGCSSGSWLCLQKAGGLYSARRSRIFPRKLGQRSHGGGLGSHSNLVAWLGAIGRTGASLRTPQLHLTADGTRGASGTTPASSCAREWLAKRVRAGTGQASRLSAPVAPDRRQALGLRWRNDARAARLPRIHLFRSGDRCVCAGASADQLRVPQQSSPRRNRRLRCRGATQYADVPLAATLVAGLGLLLEAAAGRGRCSKNLAAGGLLLGWQAGPR